MSKLDKRLVVGGAILLAVATVIVVLRPASQGDRVASRAKAPAWPSIDNASSNDLGVPADEEIKTTSQAYMPVIPPDPVTPGGSAVILGRVLDHASGQPIEGASVVEAPLAQQAGETLSTTTDAEGTFRLVVPADQLGKLRISAPGLAVSTVTLVNIAQRHLSTGDVVRVRDTRLRRGVQPIVRVIDAESQPVRGAKLLMCDEDTFRRTEETRVLGETDERGEWTATEPLAGATPSTCVLAASSSSFGFAPLALQPEGSRGHVLEIKVRPAIDLEVHASALLPLNEPLGGAFASVDLMPGVSSTAWNGLRQLGRGKGNTTGWIGAKTGPDGVAHLLVPRLEGQPSPLSVHVVLDGFDAPTVRVLARDLAKPVVVQMKRRSDAALVHAASGTVHDARGRPVAGAVVRLGTRTCVPDPVTGRYEMDLGNMPASWALGITAEAPLYARRQSKAPYAADPIVANFVLDPLTSVRGHVVDEQGHALGGIQVQLSGVPGDARASSREDGSFCLAFPWTPALQLDHMHVIAGGRFDPGAEYEETSVAVVDPRDVTVVMKRMSSGNVTVRLRVLDENGAPAPVVSAVLVQLSGYFSFRVVPPQDIVCDIGSCVARNLVAGDWYVGLVSNDDRVGSAWLHLDADSPPAEVELRVGPMRSILGKVIPDASIPAKPGDGPFRAWAQRIESWPAPYMFTFDPSARSLERMVAVVEDGTFRFDHMHPGTWRVGVDGPRGRSYRTVTVTTQADLQLTLHAKKQSEPGMLQLVNLDQRFDGPLYVRVEREDEDPVEFVADPAHGSAQTFKVMSGTSRLVVWRFEDLDVDPVTGTPSPIVKKDEDAARVVPIKRATIDIPAGETRVVALYPR